VCQGQFPKTINCVYGQIVVDWDADGQCLFVSDRVFVVVDVGLNVDPEGSVFLSVVEHKDERVIHFPVPEADVSHFNGAGNTLAIVHELKMVGGLHLEFDPAVLDLLCLGRDVHHPGVRAVFRLGYPVKLVAAAKDLAFQEIDAHLSDHV